MKKYIQITIPEPCHEDWQKMTPTQKGKHCASCKKEVVDYTKMSHLELTRVLKQGAVGCGRFTKSQLDTPIPLPRKNYKLAPYAASLLIPFTLLGSLQNKVSAKNNAQEKTSYTSLGIGRYSKALHINTITISGQLLDKTGQKLQGVSVIARTSKKEVLTNNLGFYTITVVKGEIVTFKKEGYYSYKQKADKDLLHKKITLKTNTSYIPEPVLGMFPSETLVQEKLVPIEKEIEIEPEIEILGDIITVENEINPENGTEHEHEQKLIKKTITGTINDESGLPLPAVNVIIKGTTIGTQTDFDGHYTIEATIEDTLVISYIGFNTKEIKIDNTSNTQDVILEQGDTLMTVVMTGYYEVTRQSTPTKPFGNVSFRYDPKLEQEREKRKNAYQQTKAFYNRKLAEKKAARKQKRAERKAQREANKKKK